MTTRNISKPGNGMITCLFERNPLQFTGMSFALIVSIMMLLVLLALNRLAVIHNELENIMPPA